MVYKLLQSAQKRWNRLKGFNLLALVVNNLKFQDGEQVMEQSDRKTAWCPYTRFDYNSAISPNTFFYKRLGLVIICTIRSAH